MFMILYYYCYEKGGFMFRVELRQYNDPRTKVFKRVQSAPQQLRDYQQHSGCIRMRDILEKRKRC
eukprot:COSAG01_NODE_3014_length_6720_cov_157.743845_4_plen_65_part_00